MNWKTTSRTVDGSRPAIETAERYGLRYVHVPIGYDGVPREARSDACRKQRRNT